MFHWKEFYMILPFIMILAWLIYYLSCNESTYYLQVSDVIGSITCLILKIKDFIKKIWSKFKRNTTECLGVVFQLAIAALTSFLPRDPHIWIARWIASIAIFAIICYCFKVCVEMKRAQLTPTLHYVNRRNNKKVWFFTITHGLEFLLPLSYLLLAYAYFMELHLQNHHTDNDWEIVASAIKIFIELLSALLAVMGACKVYYVAPSDQNQVIPIQIIHNIPRNWNERILIYEMIPRDVENQIVVNSDVAEVVQRDVENQSVAHVNVSEVENQSVADAPEMVQRGAAEHQSYADANVLEVAVHRDDVENQSAAEANPPEVVQRDDVEN